MKAKSKETQYIKTQVPEEQRCLFTTIRGNRCRNPHMGHATGYCILHEGQMKKVDEKEVREVAEQLLANNVELQTRDDVNRFTSQLLSLVAEKRISRQDGSLLAYIASVLLQTTAPVRRKPVVRERDEEVESVAAPIPRDPILRERFVLEPMRREPVYRERFAEEPTRRESVPHDGSDPITGEPMMPGRSYNPYTYPTKR